VLNPLSKLSRRQRRILYGTLITGAIALAYSAFVWFSEPFTDQQLSITDRLLTERDASDNVVVAAIDDDALERYGRFGDWSRELHADAIENLSSSGARVIAYDLLFVQPAEGDEALAEAISGSGGRVVLAVAGDEPAPEQDQEGTLLFGTILRPAEVLSAATEIAGHVNFPADADGIVRRVPLQVSTAEGDSNVSLAYAAFLRVFGQPVPESIPAGDEVEAVERTIPVDEQAQMVINYAGGAEAFTTLSYADVIDDDFDPELVRNKTVLVGVTYTGAGDVHRAPNVVGGLTPGIYLQANALNTLLQGRFIDELSTTQSLLIFLSLVAVLAFGLPRWPIWVGTVVTLAVVIGHEVVGFYLFDQGTVLNFVWAPLGLGLVYVSALAQRIWFEREHRREVNDLFGRYVSPQIASAIIDKADRGQLETGGELREVTVLFADLRNFTGLSEQLPPETMLGLLNECYEVIVERITENGGIVTRFGGDAVMAIWNAPQDQPGHALSACRAAWESLRILEPIYAGSPELAGSRFGFGINSGPAVVGNLGAAGRSEYTVIGDTANVASRICGAAEGGQAWIGAYTRELAGDDIEAEALPPMTVKGKSEPVLAHRLIGVTGEVAAAPLWASDSASTQPVT
jgi:class 3 adenylate cyclase/CHASE2 domain-containing sensor protein